jgi:hypothetical protein
LKLVIDTDRWKARLLGRFTLPDDLFPPETSLLKLPVVVWTFWVLVLIALGMAATVVWTSWPLHPAWAAAGYESAAKLFKAPIAVVFLLIPLLALFASNHRSVQTMRQMSLTNKQIELATGQNLFANYYKHVEEFSKWCDQCKNEVDVKSRRKLHREMFPNARDGRFQLNDAIFANFEAYVTTFLDIMSQFQNPAPGFNLTYVLSKELEQFGNTLYIAIPKYEDNSYTWNTEYGKVEFPGSGFRGFLQAHVNFIRGVDELLSFDPDYHAPFQVIRAIGIETSALPGPPNEFRPFQVKFKNLK